MLLAKNLECVRNEQVLFSSLSFSLEAQETLHIVGSNGSGKSSLLHILTGLLTPQTGAVYWQGRLISQIRQDYNQQLLYIGHKTGVKAHLTVLENLHLAASLNGAVLQNMPQILTELGLYQHQHRPCYQLSAGQRQRVALGRLLVLKANLWILDEPFTAIDVQSIELVQKIFLAHLEVGGAIILTSHQAFVLPQVNIKQISLG